MATDTTAALVETAHRLPEATLLHLDSEGWVYVSLTIFFLIAIFYAKGHRIITSKLDERIAEARHSLDEAQQLRTEAEALLLDAKKRQEMTHADAVQILAHAKVEADQIVEKARVDADTLIERRGRMAEDKIAAAERRAIADVRTKAAAAAAAAAAMLITQHHDATADRDLVAKTISSLN